MILKGFERIRKLAALGAIGSVSLFGAGSARASVSITVASIIETGTSVVWESIQNDTVADGAVLSTTALVSWPTSTTDALGIDDADLENLSYSWSGSNYNSVFASGSTTSDDLTDSFDDYAGLFLDGAPYNDPDGNLDLSGTTVTTDPMPMPNGIEVASQWHAFIDKRVLRIIYSLNNPTAAPVVTRASIGGNLGSDSSTYVAATSDGDQLVETGDTWVITHDDRVYGGVATRDPIITHIVAGGGSPAVVPVPLLIPGTGGDDDISFAYDLTIAAGETQYITWFVQLSANMTEANASLADYADIDTATTAGLFINLPPSMTVESVNWRASSHSNLPAVAIPVLGPFGLLALGGLIGLGALRNGRFRRKT